jgi:hypothetical protein
MHPSDAPIDRREVRGSGHRVTMRRWDARTGRAGREDSSDFAAIGHSVPSARFGGWRLQGHAASTLNRFLRERGHKMQGEACRHPLEVWTPRWTPRVRPSILGWARARGLALAPDPALLARRLARRPARAPADLSRRPTAPQPNRMRPPTPARLQRTQPPTPMLRRTANQATPKRATRPSRATIQRAATARRPVTAAPSGARRTPRATRCAAAQNRRTFTGAHSHTCSPRAARS